MFRRRRNDEDDAATSEDDATAAAEGTASGSATEPVAEPAPLQPRHSPRDGGPFDLDDDVPEHEAGRVDLASMQVPVIEGVEIRVDMNAEGGVVAATLTDGTSAAQLAVFAAPRSGGLWVEVLPEISQGVVESGGSLTEVQGVFGPELKGALMGTDPERGPIVQPVRFMGVDGPRWMLRALWTGRAASEGDDAAPLVMQALRGVVVNRGKDAMAPRDPLPLALPPEAAAAAAEQAAQARQAAEAQQQGRQLPEQGPTSTETR